MIRQCKECGTPIEIEDNQSWKILCTKCWLKQKHPILYEKKYLMKEIVCERCGEVFVDEAWKTLCSGCYVKDLEDKKREDLEEREQYK